MMMRIYIIKDVMCILLVVLCVMTYLPILMRCPTNKTATRRSVMETARKTISENVTESRSGRQDDHSMIHLAVVVCDRKSRPEQAMVMLKSAVLFSHSDLMFHIFADNDLQMELEIKLDSWPHDYWQKISYKIYNVSFPDTYSLSSSQWKYMFRPCATERLFFPRLLPDVDALIYLDTDILFLSPIDELWAQFLQFEASHVAAAAKQREYPNDIDINRKIPVYGKYGIGINSGVMLMNLTRIRATSFINMIEYYSIHYGSELQFGDQDLLNIYFHFHSDELFLLTCDWNYCSDFCSTGRSRSRCVPAEAEGARVIHGNRNVFEGNRQPMFRSMYLAFEQYDLKTKDISNVVKSVDKYINDYMPSNCGLLKDVFTKRIRKMS